MYDLRDDLESAELAADRLGLTHPQREELMKHDVCRRSLEEVEEEEGASWLAEYREYLSTRPSTRIGLLYRRPGRFSAIFEAHFEKMRAIGVDFYQIITKCDRAKANVFLKSNGLQVPKPYESLGYESIIWSAKIPKGPKNPRVGKVAESEGMQANLKLRNDSQHDCQDQNAASSEVALPYSPHESERIFDSSILTFNATEQPTGSLSCDTPEYVRVPSKSQRSTRATNRPPKLDLLEPPLMSTIPTANKASLNQVSSFRLSAPKKPVTENQQFATPTEKRAGRSSRQGADPNTVKETGHDKSLSDPKKKGEIRMYNNVRRDSGGSDVAQNGSVEGTPDSNPSTGRARRTAAAMRLPDRFANDDVTPIRQAGGGNTRPDRSRKKNDMQTDYAEVSREVSVTSTAIGDHNVSPYSTLSSQESSSIPRVPLLMQPPKRRSMGRQASSSNLPDDPKRQI